MHQASEDTVMNDGQREYARPSSETQKWGSSSRFDLLSVVKAVKPTALVGTSTMARAFDREVIEEMASHVDRPIVLPLSNPTRLAEADPHDVTEWTQGRAIIATGSPFPPVHNPRTGKEMAIAELNNALIFPGLGLGTVLSKAKHLDDAMIVAGVEALASLSPSLQDTNEPLLPDLEEVQQVSIKVAAAVWRKAQEGGQARAAIPEDVGLEEYIEEQMWKPVYKPLHLAR